MRTRCSPARSARATTSTSSARGCSPDNGDVARASSSATRSSSPRPTAPKGGAAGVGSPGVYAAQLRLTDAQSQKLEWILAHGKDWRFEIRPSADAANSPRWHETGNTMLKDGVGER